MGGSLSSPGRRGLKQELYNAVEAAPGETEALGQEEPGSGRKRRGSLEEAFWARQGSECGWSAGPSTPALNATFNLAPPLRPLVKVPTGQVSLCPSWLCTDIAPQGSSLKPAGQGGHAHL